MEGSRITTAWIRSFEEKYESSEKVAGSLLWKGYLYAEAGVQNLTEGEQKAGYTYVWKTMSEALAIFGTYEDYHDTDIAYYGLYRREFFALSEV